VQRLTAISITPKFSKRKRKGKKRGEVGLKEKERKRGEQKKTTKGKTKEKKKSGKKGKSYQAFLRREPSVIRVEYVNLTVLFQPNDERDVRITLLAEFKRLPEQRIASSFVLLMFCLGLIGLAMTDFSRLCHPQKFSATVTDNRIE
jgi:hypothetical protein